MDQVEGEHAQQTELRERRSNARTATVFRPVLIETSAFTGFCLIRNLSETGIMGHVYADLVDNVPVTMHFDQFTKVAGTLIWCRDGRVGVGFDRTMGIDIMLAKLAAKEINGKLIRPPRLPLECKGKLLIGNRTLAVEVQDVSQRGIKIRTSFILPGDELYVEISGLEQRKAVVRWTREYVAGLHFVHPLSFEQLARWAVAQQAENLSELCVARSA